MSVGHICVQASSVAISNSIIATNALVIKTQNTEGYFIILDRIEYIFIVEE